MQTCGDDMANLKIAIMMTVLCTWPLFIRMHAFLMHVVIWSYNLTRFIMTWNSKGSQQGPLTFPACISKQQAFVGFLTRKLPKKLLHCTFLQMKKYYSVEVPVICTDHWFYNSKNLFILLHGNLFHMNSD